MAFDIYETITSKIIEQLEAGIIPWQKPWTGTASGAISHVTGKPYSLVNQMLLFKPGEYLTMKQCDAEGGRVKKGSHAKFIVFWKIVQKQKTTKDGAPVFTPDGIPVVTGYPVLKYINVFHIDDCEGIEPKVKPNEPTVTVNPIEAAENALTGYVKRSGVGFENRLQDEAYYSPLGDRISLPKIEQFTDAAEYYSTAFHEATHSTGHKSRLDRFTTSSTFGSESYSKEELIAKIGAASILNRLGIDTAKTFRNSAGYIQSWLRKLKNDKTLIVSAASKAEKAVDLILCEEK